MKPWTSGWLYVMRWGNVGIFRCFAYEKWLMKYNGFSLSLDPTTMISGLSVAGCTGSAAPLSGSAQERIRGLSGMLFMQNSE